MTRILLVLLFSVLIACSPTISPITFEITINEVSYKATHPYSKSFYYTNVTGIILLAFNRYRQAQINNQIHFLNLLDLYLGRVSTDKGDLAAVKMGNDDGIMLSDLMHSHHFKYSDMIDIKKVAMKSLEKLHNRGMVVGSFFTENVFIRFNHGLNAFCRGKYKVSFTEFKDAKLTTSLVDQIKDKWCLTKDWGESSNSRFVKSLDPTNGHSKNKIE